MDSSIFTSQFEVVDFDQIEKQSDFIVVNKKISKLAISIFVIGLYFCVFIPLLIYGNITPTIAMLSLLLLIVPVTIIWHEIKEGAFILAANEKGFFYRQRKNHNRGIFIAWKYISEICAKRYDGFKKIVFVIEFPENNKLPQPACGEAIDLSPELALTNVRGKWQLVFEPRLGNSANNIVNALNRIKSIYANKT